MKKLFCLICALLLVGAMTVCFASAETLDTTAETVPVEETTLDVVDVPDINVGEPLTWTYLATIAGAAAFTLLIVQFFKAPLDKVWKIPTRAFAYIIALAIMLVATAFTSGLTAENVLLVAANAFLAAMSAYGAYEITFAKLSK